MKPEEQATVDAITAKLLGEFFVGQRVKFDNDVEKHDGTIIGKVRDDEWQVKWDKISAAQVWPGRRLKPL